MKRASGVSAAVMAVVMGFKAFAAETSVDIGSELQLMWDDALVDTSRTTAQLVSHRPEFAGTVLTFDKPWEGSACDYFNILEDEDAQGRLYRMYYLAWHFGRMPGTSPGPGETAFAPHVRVCMLTSRDGLAWERPNLGRFSFRGSKDNNILFDETAPKPGTRPPVKWDNFFVFKDSRPGCPRAERYKALALDYRTGDKGVLLADGLGCWISSNAVDFVYGWRTGLDPRCGISGDTLNVAFWNEKKGVYELFGRGGHATAKGADREGTMGTRDVQRTWSKDFRTWDRPKQIEFEGDVEDCGLYTNCVEPYPRKPGTLVGFPTRYVERLGGWTDNYNHLPDLEARKYRISTYPKRWVGDIRYGKTITDCIFMFARDGGKFRRIDEAYLRPGPEHGRNWQYGDCYPARGLIETPGRRGDDPEYSQFVSVGHWSDGGKDLDRYAIRVDGFCSYRAKYNNRKPYLLTTKRVTFSGEEMRINFSTSARGGLYVTIRNEAGRSITTDEIFGDAIDRPVGFRDGKVADFAGKPVTIEFRMSDADLYSFRFGAKKVSEKKVRFASGNTEVVIAEGASASIVRAAEEATNVLTRAFGRTVPLEYARRRGRSALLIGIDRPADLAENGYVIDATGSCVSIAGRPEKEGEPDENGVRKGVRAFLRKAVGADFGAKSVNVPKRASFEIREGRVVVGGK